MKYFIVVLLLIVSTSAFSYSTVGDHAYLTGTFEDFAGVQPLSHSAVWARF